MPWPLHVGPVLPWLGGQDACGCNALWRDISQGVADHSQDDLHLKQGAHKLRVVREHLPRLLGVLLQQALHLR